MSTHASVQRDDVPLIEVEDVSLDPQLAQTYGLSIELPASGTRYYDSYSFPLEGRISNAGSLLGIDLFHRGARLQRVWGRQHGLGDDGSVRFSWPANALAMPPDFEAEIRAVLQDRTQVPLVTIRGRREPLRTGFEPALQPLSITTLPRSGSTVLVRALEQHPEIAACPAFEYETTVSVYWLSVLRDLSEPASYRNQLVHDVATRAGAEWWRASRRPLPHALADSRLERIVGRNAVRELAIFCQAQIDLVYSQLADRFGRPNASYFAERTGVGPLLALLHELYPHGRQIVLIRDFRDQLCSVIEFFSRQGLLGVSRDRDRVVELARHSGRSAMKLLERYRRAEGRVHVLRYEDMVLAPAEAFTALLEYLSVPAEPAVVAAMADAVHRRDSRSDSHRTVADAAASIGRWKRDLRPDVVEAAADELRAALDAFGYS